MAMKAKRIHSGGAIILAILMWAGCGGATKPFTTPPATASEYVVATSNNQVLAFAVNTNTGALGQPMTAAGPAASGAVAVSASGKFVYATDPAHTGLDVYSLNGTTGAMSAVTGSPFPLGVAAAAMALDPASKFLYATGGSGTAALTAFTLSSVSGGPAGITGSPFATGSGPTGAVVDPSGKFLYVADSTDANGGISAYTINSSSGALTAITGSPFPSLTVGGPNSMVVSPNGKFLFVCEAGLDDVVALPINTNGSLGSFVGTPSLVGNRPVGIAINAAGTFLYVANSLDATISVFAASPTTGVLTPITGSPFAAGATISGIVIDPTGKYLYATNPAANTITGFTINGTTGAITQFAGAPAAAGTQPASLTAVAIP